MINNILNYIKTHWLLIGLASVFLGCFVYLTFTGNQLCDCATTETYRDGTTKSSSHGRSFYRYYHK